MNTFREPDPEVFNETVREEDDFGRDEEDYYQDETDQF